MDRNLTSGPWVVGYPQGEKMTHENNTRPFNLEHAKAGAPYGLRNGLDAKIYHYGKEKIIGLQHGTGGAEFAGEWNLDGSHTFPGHVGALDLVMRPVGMCEGKPAFMGDKLLHYATNEIVEVEPDWQRAGDWGPYVWPNPAQKWPTTTLNDDGIMRAAVGDKVAFPIALLCSASRLRTVCNAVIAHECEAGNLIPSAMLLSLVKFVEDSVLKSDDGIRYHAIDHGQVLEAWRLGLIPQIPFPNKVAQPLHFTV